MIWAIIGGYVVCGLITGRICATLTDNDNSNLEDVKVSAFFGVVLWPAAALLGTAILLVNVLTYKLPEQRKRERRESLRRQEQEAKQRMQEIHRLERKLGIGEGN